MKTYPVIGISGSRNDEQGQLFVRENYMQSVLNAGAVPVLLPRITDERAVDALLDTLDGLLLAGGVDVGPSFYGEQTLPSCGEIDSARDAFELLVTRKALERSMPVFGICRGIQMLAVAMGGTLYQDIETQLGIERIRHYQHLPYDAPSHAVRFAQGGLFERLTGVQELMVNSMHHQSIKDAGPNLIVEGRSADGIIEAVRAKDCETVFAVQYHPEYLSDQASFAALFEHFARAAQAYAEAKPMT